MIISLFEEKTDNLGFESLERKMARTLAVYRELKPIMARELEIGRRQRPLGLQMLLLKKRNCINCLEELVRSIDRQLTLMGDGVLPRTMPRTLPNRIRAISRLTPEAEAALMPLARALDAENLAFITAARHNKRLLKEVLNRLGEELRQARGDRL